MDDMYAFIKFLPCVITVWTVFALSNSVCAENVVTEVLGQDILMADIDSFDLMEEVVIPPPDFRGEKIVTFTNNVILDHLTTILPYNISELRFLSYSEFLDNCIQET